MIQQKANREEAAVYLLGRDFKLTENNYFFLKTKLSFRRRSLVENYDIAVALTAFLLLKLPLTEEQMRQAIDQTQIPGRYQILSQKPLIILDGAHNIQAMTELLTDLRQKEPHKKFHVLITMMKDKDLSQVFALFKKNDDVTLTTIPYPRAAKKDDFPKEIQAKYRYQADYRHAFQTLRQQLTTHDLLLVTGSFYLVSAILQMEDKDASSRH